MPIKSCAKSVIYYQGQTNVFAQNLNSSDPVNTIRNVSLSIALIAFWAYTKRPLSLV